MKYDFTSVVDRTGKDAIAVDGLGVRKGAPQKPTKEGFDVIPMWIADMNFATVPTVPQAIAERLKHPFYGYFMPRKEYFESIIKWQEKRFGITGIKAENIGYENGVLGGVATACNILLSKGGNVLVHSPTYIGFTNTLKNNGYNIVHSPLYLDNDNVWRMDFDDMEKKLVDNDIHTAIFCSPHNPSGRVWEHWEVERAMALFKKHDVYVISDEIWSDIVMPGHKHVPTHSVSEDAHQRTITMYAPSKTFSLAGLVGSYHLIFNKYLNDRFLKESSLSHYNSMNMLSMYALIGAYKPEGYEWLDELNQVLSQNIDWAADYVTSHFEGCKISKPQGTYLLFIDCTDWCAKHGKSIDDVQHACWDVGVALQDGRQFHGPCHLRVNIALPHSRVKEAFERMDKYVFNVK